MESISGRTFIASLELSRLRVPVRLGVGDEERAQPQWVSFDIALDFENVPKGSASDQISDTINYEIICQTVEKVCRFREFKLVEKLGADVFIALKEIVPGDSLLWLRTTKERTPIAALEGGASFVCSDPGWQ